MNSLVTRPVAFPLLVTLGLMVLLLPLATWHLGDLGLWIVASAAAVVTTIVVLTALTQQLLPNLSHHPLKQLALVGGLRMALSLTAVLAVSIAAHQYARPEVLIYALPFYLGLLGAETAVTVSQIKRNTGGLNSASRSID